KCGRCRFSPCRALRPRRQSKIPRNDLTVAPTGEARPIGRPGFFVWVWRAHVPSTLGEELCAPSPFGEEGKRKNSPAAHGALRVPKSAPPLRREFTECGKPCWEAVFRHKLPGPDLPRPVLGAHAPRPFSFSAATHRFRETHRAFHLQ